MILKKLTIAYFHTVIGTILHLATAIADANYLCNKKIKI